MAEPAGPEVREVRGGRTLFVSDVHLTPAEPEVYVAFCRFLEEEAPGARALHVLGDLFDFWVGPAQARVPGFGEVFPRLRALRDAGTDVTFVRGNRDFALDGAFAAARGLRVLPDVAETTVGERRVLLTHGDLLVTRDAGYQRMRRVLRSGAFRLAMRALPLRVTLRVAQAMRRASGGDAGRKPERLFELDFALARRWLSRGCDAMVCGHVHRGCRYRLDVDGRPADVFVLGAWEDGPNWVEGDGSGLALKTRPLGS